MTQRYPSQAQIDRAFQLARKDCFGRTCMKAPAAQQCLVRYTIDRLAKQRGWYFGPKAYKKLAGKVRSMYHAYKKTAAKCG